MVGSFSLAPLALYDIIPVTPAVLLIAVFIGVLVSDLIGNMIAFDTPFVNAFVTMTVATIIVYGLSRAIGITAYEPFNNTLTFLGVAALVFVSDMVGNLITFGKGKRFANALTTAVIAVVLVGVGLFVLNPSVYSA